MLAMIDSGSRMRTTSRVAGQRVTVISSEQPGRSMAGPAIRAVNLADQLQSAGLRVRLAVPEEPDVQLPVPVAVFGKPSSEKFRQFAVTSDLVITQPQRLDVARGLHSGEAKIIYDLYVPAYVEYPASLGADDFDSRLSRLRVERNWMEYAAAISSGDAFIVASQTQIDYLLGALGQAGRLQDLRSSGGGPPIALVPFGIPDDHPAEAQPGPLRGGLVPEDSIIAVWTGGLWNWFDPVTVIQGLIQARRSDPRLHLVFLGSGSPSGAFLGGGDAEEALRGSEIQAAFESGSVKFAAEWVPYQERWQYLSDADFVVNAHLDSLETRMSFRTRLLDPLWAGLPTLTTEGGVLSDIMCSADAAICLPAGDSRAWSEAMLKMAGDPDQRNQMSAAAQRLAADFRWSTVTKPLLELINQVADGELRNAAGPGRMETLRYLSKVLQLKLRH
jgi:glycosyltransferase involved in cell wall biosynthesis